MEPGERLLEFKALTREPPRELVNDQQSSRFCRRFKLQARSARAKLFGMTEAIRDADEDSFAELIERHRRELHAHCFRMLGSVHDADDALQEALLGAWKGLSGFEGRSSLRSWLYTIATNASLRVLEGCKRRELPAGTGTVHDPRAPLAEPLAESVWIEPYPDELPR